MFWLASFPRSGNTFFRNLMFEVYGINSGSHDTNEFMDLEDKIARFEMIKTHMLPEEIDTKQKLKSIELVRDARDALVSIAHHRTDIIAPGSDFNQNLIEAIKAEGGSFFGGWSKNVEAWFEVSDVVLRFEDFITNPIKESKKINLITKLSEPDETKIPSFDQLKFGKMKYGTKKTLTEEENVEWRKKFFRKGKVGGWKDDLTDEQHQMIWDYHGKTMEKIGYSFDGEIEKVNLKGSEYKKSFLNRIFG